MTPILVGAIAGALIGLGGGAELARWLAGVGAVCGFMVSQADAAVSRELGPTARPASGAFLNVLTLVALGLAMVAAAAGMGVSQ